MTEEAEPGPDGQPAPVKNEDVAGVSTGATDSAVEAAFTPELEASPPPSPVEPIDPLATAPLENGAGAEPAPPVALTEQKPPRRPIGAPYALIFAFLGMGVVDAFALMILSPPTAKLRKLRFSHHAYALGHAILIGLIGAGITALYLRARRPFEERLSPLRLAALDTAALAAFSLALGYLFLTDDLGNLAGRFADAHPTLATPLLVGLVVVVSVGLPSAVVLARLFSSSWGKWMVLPLGLSLAVVNHRVLTQDYPGAHLFLFVTGGAIAAAALAPLRARSMMPRPIAIWIARADLIVAAALAGWSAISTPTSKLAVEMLRIKGSNLAPFLARIHASATHFAQHARVPSEQREWFTDRTNHPDVPPTNKFASDKHDDIVIFLTIDSLRADVVESGKFDTDLPVMAALRREGLHFTMARSPGSQTVYGLSAAFAGKYFSQMYWTHYGTDIWLPHDESIRFPALLVKAGVTTTTFASKPWLSNEFGIIRGFNDETVLQPNGTPRMVPPLAPEVVDAIVARLEKQGPGPMFLFAHFMDPHAPYFVPGGGSSHEKFIRALAQVDKEIGRIRTTLEAKGMTGRTTLIVTADHGEAFGEHGATMHGMNLYEEMLRIPLLVVGPKVVPRAEATPVSLIDIGPTVLDIYGLPTPGIFMGQSLLPLFRGEKADLTRPIVAEGRLKQAMILPNGLKLIRNQREGTQEIYDLKKDPKEKDDKFEAMGQAGREQMALIETFFDAHILRSPRGYKPPYRR
jgi:hypothetical protein